MKLEGHNSWSGYDFAWLTLGFFLLSLAGHWVLGWFAYVQDQASQHQPVEWSAYLIAMGRDTLENWQSEFLQLIWQVGGLAYLLWLGSPSSKEGDERKEEKIDAILMRLDPVDGARVIARLDARYPRK